MIKTAKTLALPQAAQVLLAFVFSACLSCGCRRQPALPESGAQEDIEIELLRERQEKGTNTEPERVGILITTEPDGTAPQNNRRYGEYAARHFNVGLWK